MGRPKKKIIETKEVSKNFTFTPPKDRINFVHLKMAAMNCYPEEILAHIVKADEEAIEKLGCDVVELDIRFRAACARELMKYMYPALKAVEISGPDGTINLSAEDRKKEIAKLMKKAFG